MFVIPLATVWLLAQPPVSGPQTATATLSVNLGSHARLSFGASTLVFPDADPDTVPAVPATPPEVAITARARAQRNAQVTLTLQAADDLRSGLTTMPASLIRWSASGAGFVGGTLSRTAAQLVGSWTGSGVRSGAQSFVFENSWMHPPGTYSVTLVYTMSTP